ncbi:MAG: nucleotide sugar dehydrogenase [Gemmatimonadota bacterium]
MSPRESLLRRIEDRDARVAVVGLGYVGLPVAAHFAEGGFDVIGLDVNPAVVEAVSGGRSHIEDVASGRVERLVADGKLSATDDFDALADADAVIVCVPTPLSKTQDPDVSYVKSATEDVRDRLRPGQLVVLESTTYPGTTREMVLETLEESGLEVGEDFFLAFSPERIDPGNETWTFGNTPKVVGGLTASCHELAVALYEQVVDEVVEVSSPEAAELTKILENTFRAVNIALANEMAVIADRLGIDVWEVIDAAATKPYGFMRFHPGPGLGGHCIPVDPHYLSWKMESLQYRTRFIELASDINAEMPRHVVSKVADALNEDQKSVNGSRVLVLGAAYKPNVDDTRESPALDVIRLLEEKGASVRYHDPHVPEVKLGEEETRRSVELTAGELEACDAAVVATDHDAIDWRLVVDHAPAVVDARNALAGMEGSARVHPLAGPARRGRPTRPEGPDEVERTVEAARATR